MLDLCFYWVKSYVLGEIPSKQDRITIVRQLWDLTQDVLVSFNPMDMFMSQDVHTLVLMAHGIVLPMFVIEFVSPGPVCITYIVYLFQSNYLGLKLF